MNHSCEPNAGLKNDRYLVAIENIAKGEEVNIDYSTLFLEGWSMKCECGRKSCRKLISTFDTLSPKDQERLKDYISSYVHIIYGTENVYGVVSRIKNVRAGINEYLGGYLKEENIRFREYEIGFKGHSESEIKTPVALEYGKFSKAFEDFKFESDAGKIRKGEILGLVGKNALGKSLLVKMLAGVEKADKGEALELKISYKPQYITAEDKFVHEIFKPKELNATVFEECKRKLKLHPFMDKKLTELSGGELQRVAIAAALCRDADIYIFDEPSSHLDVSQRIKISKKIRTLPNEGKTVLVAEHDLAMLDYLSDQVSVIYGEPGVYGIISHNHGVRVGINIYLNGFLPDENMRFRNDSIKFHIRPPRESEDSEKGSRIFWPNMKKDFSSKYLPL